MVAKKTPCESSYVFVLCRAPHSLDELGSPFSAAIGIAHTASAELYDDSSPASLAISVTTVATREAGVAFTNDLMISGGVAPSSFFSVRQNRKMK